jgi:hypothetical protein
MRKSRFVPELIAPCGMNCGICMAYLRERNKCTSCRGPDKNKPVTRTKCKIKTCNRLYSRFCYDCEDFPCDRLVHLDKRYRTKYGMSMIENLASIQKDGISQFLKKEDERWKCPICGGVICVHNRMCYACDKTVGGSKSS